MNEPKMSNKLTNNPLNVQNIEQFTKHEQGKEMNANELADELKTILTDSESYYGNAEEYLLKAETMIRHQQAEIEALKADGKVCARCGAIAFDPVITQTSKTLTDEEIEQVGKETMLLQFFQSIEATADHGDSVARTMTAMIRQQAFDFARAILKKAQSNCNGFCGEYECKENQNNCKRKAQEK